MADDFQLKWDAQNQQLYGEDPDTGETVPIPFDSVSTDEADVTNETSVEATRAADSASTSAGTWINAYDSESKDIRGELNSSAQFSPDESGDYFITIGIDIRGSTSKGDLIRTRVQNVTDNSTVDNSFFQAPASFAIQNSPYIVTLDSSKTYELQITNSDSSFQALSNDNAVGRITRSVVG